MLVRVESVKNSDVILIINELGKFIGQTNEIEFFISCTLKDKDPIEEDGYTFYFVNKECLTKLINNAKFK